MGEPGQQDRLTFTRFAHQIEAAREKGYRDNDIIRGVIRAIIPGSALRSYLEGRTQMTLPSLRRILRCHYQESDATDLYKQLAQSNLDLKAGNGTLIPFEGWTEIELKMKALQMSPLVTFPVLVTKNQLQHPS